MSINKQGLAQAAEKVAEQKVTPRVFVVDDHPIFTEVLAELLNQSGEFLVVGSAGDGRTALAMMAEMQVDLLLLDLMLPDLSGLEVLEQLRLKRSTVRIVVYSGMASDESIAAAYSRGACAVLEKSAHVNELMETLRAVMRGEFPMNSRMSGVLREMVRQRTVSNGLGRTDLLILRRLAMRHTAKEIAVELESSVSAVYKARTRIMRRMGLTSRSGFAQAAESLGLVLSDPRKAAPVAALGARSDGAESAP